MITKQELKEEVKFSKLLERPISEVYYYSNQEVMTKKSRDYNKLNKEKIKQKKKVYYIKKKKETK